MKDVTNVFKLRLKELRGDKSQNEVAKSLNISRSALSYYESGERVPDINVLYSLAEYFDVSADYLLGITDIKKPDIETAAISRKTGLTKRSIETLEYMKISDYTLRIPEFEDNFIYRYLKTQVINLLIGGTWDILDDITNFLFVEFTHFSSFYKDDCQQLPISDLELYDARLDIYFSEDYDFYSKAFLLNLQHDLQTLRGEYSTAFHELVGDESLSVPEIYEKLKLFFLKQKI